MMIKNKKGIVFVTVMVASMLMIFIAVSASNMLMQDAQMIKHLKRSTQAQYLAEAGVCDALATLARNGFFAKDNPANFPLTNLGGGTFDVTITQSGGRVLITSVGTFEGASKTVSLEVKDNTPTSLYYMMSSGSDLSLGTFLLGWADVNGDMHANGNMDLYSFWAGWIDVDACSNGDCDGTVSASGTVDVWEGWWWGSGTVTIHGNGGNPIEGAPAVTFPNFDYVYYKALATASGDYHSGDVTFTNDALTPTNGIIYVEGTATFRGTCNLDGGIVANRIYVLGQLHQHKSGTTNVIISRNNDIVIIYRLSTEEALVYAGRDFFVLDVGANINVTGTLIASRYLDMWQALTNITYNHEILYPDGLIIGSGDLAIEIVSWNT